MRQILPVLATILTFAAPPAKAQTSQAAAGTREAMAKVAALLEGRWRGHGTVRLGARPPYALECTVVATSKADGTVLLLDAPYSLAPPDRPAEAARHDEIAVLSFDPTAHEYRLDIFYADGRHETGSGRLDGRVLRIVSSVSGAGFRRITIDLTSPDTYHETGERSRDGSAWEAYSNIILKRVQP
jgi:hypothetical protein